MANKTKIRASLLNVEREHQTKATLVLDDEEHEVTLVYRGRSAGQGRKLREVMDADDKYMPSDFVAIYLVSILELVGDDEQPYPITKEFIETWDTTNVQAVHAAITEAMQGPNKLPSTD